jgi:hypothetical protein
MWYNIVPPFVPMDLNMYSTYYSRIKGPNPLIFGKKERCDATTTQLKPVPPIELLKCTQDLIRVPTSRLKQSILIPRSAHVQQAVALPLHVNIHVATGLSIYDNGVPF